MSASKPFTDEEKRLWRLFLDSHRTVKLGIDDALLSSSSLSTAEFSVLASLSDSGEHGARLRELCETLGWDRSRTSHQIARMERRGLVTKTACPVDGRGVVVTMTDAGRQHFELGLVDYVESVRRLVFDRLSPAEQDNLRDIALKILGDRVS